MNDIERWEKRVQERRASCYIKPTRLKHDSGFRQIEVGYCTINGKNKVQKNIILSHSDHVHSDFMGLVDPKRAFCINMDLTIDGYIRIWGSETQCVIWDKWPMSSAELTLMENKRKDPI